MIFNENIISLHSKRFGKDFEKYSQLYNIICDDIFDGLQDLMNFNPKTFINLSNKSDYLTNLIKNKLNLTVQNNTITDLIVAPMILHIENNPVEFLKNTIEKLNKNGIFMGNFFGGQTLQELRNSFLIIESDCKTFYPHVIPMVDIKDAGKIMQLAGFKDISINSKIITIFFKNCYSLMQWLHNSGESNPLSQQNQGLYSKKKLEKVCKYYDDTYQENNKIYATFEIISLFGVRSFFT